jgi:hypothetical protein
MLQLVAPSANERHSWLKVLNNGVPFSTVVYDTTRSLPETPLDAIEACETIEEDKDSLENYEIMSTPDQEDIYNSLEDLSPPPHQAKAAPPPPPPVSMTPPALPQTNRPSLLALKKANAPPPPTPATCTDDTYDDTCNVTTPTPHLPSMRPKGVPPPTPLRKNNSSLHMEVYDDAGARDDVYDDAGTQQQVTAAKMDVNNKIGFKPPVAIKNTSRLHMNGLSLELEMEVYDDAGARDDVYDDACGTPAPAAKQVPRAPVKMAKAPPPSPPAKNVCNTVQMEIYDEAGAQDDVYDDAAGNDDQGMYYDIEEMAQSVRAEQSKKPSGDKPPPLPPLTSAMKSPPPDPPSGKMKPEPPYSRKTHPTPAEPAEAEMYDEVGPAHNAGVPPPLPAANGTKPSAGRPMPPPMNRKPSVSKLQVDETYDEVAPPKDLASELKNFKLKSGGAGAKTQPPPTPSSKAEDIRDAGTLTKQLARLKPVNSVKKTEPLKKPEVPSSTENGRPLSLAENRFKQADSAVFKKFNQAPAEQQAPAGVKNFRSQLAKTNGTAPVNKNNKPVTSSKPTSTAPKMMLANKSKFETAPQSNGFKAGGDDLPVSRGSVRNIAKKIGGQLG